MVQQIKSETKSILNGCFIKKDNLRRHLKPEFQIKSVEVKCHRRLGFICKLDAIKGHQKANVPKKISEGSS